MRSKNSLVDDHIAITLLGILRAERRREANILQARPAQVIWDEVLVALRSEKAATKEVRDAVLLRMQNDGSIKAVDSPNGKEHVRLWQVTPKGEDLLRSIEDRIAEEKVVSMRWRVAVYLALLGSGLVVLGLWYNHVSKN